MAVIDFSKALTGDTATMVFYAKRLLGGGEVPFEKSHFISAIQARADATQPDKLTPAQRFSRCMCDDDIGRLLYKAVKAAPGSEVKPGSDTPEVEMRPQHLGPAHARMHSMAVDHSKAKSMSYAGAYSYLYSHPDNVKLREEIKREHLEHALAGIHGGGPASGSLTIQEAERMEPARDFSATGTGDYSRQVARKSAQTELEGLARDYHASHPDKSYEQSFCKILVAPENRLLAKRAQSERLAALGAA